MKITKEQLRNLVKEEVKLLKEAKKPFSDDRLRSLAQMLPSAWAKHLNDPEFLDAYRKRVSSLAHSADIGGGGMTEGMALFMYLQYVKNKIG